jgi:hypothetical protein
MVLPTVFTNALMLFIVINAHEGGHVSTAVITDAYMKANMDDVAVEQVHR